jgi:hypothetical protein
MIKRALLALAFLGAPAVQAAAPAPLRLAIEGLPPGPCAPAPQSPAGLSTYTRLLETRLGRPVLACPVADKAAAAAALASNSRARSAAAAAAAALAASLAAARIWRCAPDCLKYIGASAAASSRIMSSADAPAACLISACASLTSLSRVSAAAASLPPTSCSAASLPPTSCSAGGSVSREGMKLFLVPHAAQRPPLA